MGLNMCPYCGVNSLQQKRLKSVLVRWLPKLICPHHCLLPASRRMHLRIIPRSSLSLLLQTRHFHRGGYRLHPFSSSCFISSKSDIFTEKVTGSTPFPPFVSYLRKRHFHREGYWLHPFSSSCFIPSQTALSPRGLPAPPLFILFFQIFKNSIFTERVTGSTPFRPLASYLQNLHIHREGYRLHPFSSYRFMRELPAPPLFILLFHIFKNDIFTERVTGSTPFHPLVSYLQRQHFHILSPKGLPARPLFVLLLHIFKTCIFTERVTGSTPFHPLVSYLQRRPFHREGYRLHPFSSSCFISSKTAFSPRELPAPPLFIFLFHFFKNDIFTERVTGFTPFHPLVSYLQRRPFHREGYRLHPFSSSCFISSKTASSPRELPAPPVFILLFHIFKDDIFTERVNGSTPFHPLVSCLQKRRFHREGYRLHPFSPSCFISSKMAVSPRGLPARPLSSSCFRSSKTAFSPRGLPAPPLFILLLQYLQKQHFHREGYRLHPFSSFCFISSNSAFSPKGSPAPPLFFLLFHIFKNSIFTERVNGPTPFHPLLSYLQRRPFHREGYQLHPFSSSCFISSKTACSPRGLPAPPLLILFFRIFKNSIFTERVTGPTPFSSSCSISSTKAFSPRGLRAPPLFILLFHMFKNGTFTERVTGSTPFHPLVSYLQTRPFHRKGHRLHPFSSSCFISSKSALSPRGLPAPPLFILFFFNLQRPPFHREGCRLHPFSSSCFISSKTALSPRGLPAPPLLILFFQIFKNDIFTESFTGSTPFHPFVSFLQRRHFHRGGYRLHPFSSSSFISSKTTFSPRALPAPPLFILLFHIFKNGIFTEGVTGSTPFHPLVSYLQNLHIHREGDRLHPFSSSCFIFSKTAFSRRGLPAPPLFILFYGLPLLVLLFHISLKTTFSHIFTEGVTGSTLSSTLGSSLQRLHFHREGYRLHPFSSSCFMSC